MKTSNLQIIESLSQFLEKAMNQKTKYCQRIEDFSRSRLLSFSSVAYFILNLSKRSLSLELNDFFELLYPNNQIQEGKMKMPTLINKTLIVSDINLQGF